MQETAPPLAAMLLMSGGSEDADAEAMARLRAAVANETTRRTYEARLRQLRHALRAPSLRAVALAPERHVPTLRRWHAQRRKTVMTVKNYVTALLVFFRHDPGLASAPEAHARWKALHKELLALEEEAYKRNEPVNSRQVRNYVPFHEIPAKLAQLEAAPDPHATLRQSMQLLLLAFYAHTLPKRSDLGALHVYRGPPRAPQAVLRARNYVVLMPPGAAGAAASLLVLHKHKTAKTYGETVEVLNAPLQRVLRTSLARWPRDYVFVTNTGGPMCNNTFSKFVMRTFAALFDGRAAGTALLRHAYVSGLDFNQLSMQARDEIARGMGHTAHMQGKVYKWVHPPGASAC